MKKLFFFLTLLTALVTSCQDKDIEREDMKIQPISADVITGNLVGDDYTWTWTAPAGMDMQVTLYVNGTKSGSVIATGNSYTHNTVNTNVEYTYVFKLTDGTNFSSGVIKTYTREGATQVSGITMAQVDKPSGYDALIEWNATTDADNILLVATNGSQTINQTLSGTVTSYTIPNVVVGDTWNVTLTAQNSKGNSLPATSSLRIGKTAIGFLTIYNNEADLLANGDDDEASAWLWLKNEYSTATLVPFNTITSTADVDPYRVLFWLRDLETGNEADIWNMPAVVTAATPYIKQWYEDGGNLLLWSHAVPYIGTLGRLETSMLQGVSKAFGAGVGGINNDVWRVAVEATLGSFRRDFSTHAIYRGIETVTVGGVKMIEFKGAGWTEDHNCLFFDIPSTLTGLGNQDEACYNTLTATYGIYPLATWDSQTNYISQLNIWEAQQGNTNFKGTILCIGNGGCEFAMKNLDGTPQVSALPTNNSRQGNILKLAKNSLEYLKTR